MCSHHLIEPVVCTPASGWKKGQRLPRPDLPQDMVRPGLTEGDLS
jgi:hypothetical protein